MRCFIVSIALVKLDFEVLSHHTDQVPDDLQVDILCELWQSKEDSSQMHRLTVLLQYLKVDSESLFDDLIVIL